MQKTETGSEMNENIEQPEEIFDVDEIINAVAEEEVGEDENEPPVKPLNKELMEAQEKYLRLAAEFDNYRKRTLREKTELIQNAGTQFDETVTAVLISLIDEGVIPV